MKKDKISIRKLLLVIALLVSLFSISIFAKNTTSKENVVLPELSYDDNKYYIKELNLNTGKTRKNLMCTEAIRYEEIERVFDLGNGNVILIGMENYGNHNGYALAYNIDSKKLTIFDLQATTAEDIAVKKGDGYFVINYNKSKSSETYTIVYDIETLKIKAKWRSLYRTLMNADNEYIYYSKDDNVYIYSKTGKNIKNVNLKAKCEKINNRCALTYEPDGIYKVTDLFTLESKKINIPIEKVGYGYLDDCNKQLVVLTGKSTKSSKFKYTGEVVIINTESNKRKELIIDSNNLNTSTIKSGESIYFKNNKIYMSGKVSLECVDLDSGHRISRPLQ